MIASNMPFPFAEVCTLFQRLEVLELREPPLLPDEHLQHTRLTVESWFKSHRSAISALAVGGAVALLSALLPEKRIDRVYGMQAPGLCRILARCLKLQAHREKDLRAYTQPGRGDLAACLERVLDNGGPPARPAVTLEEVDDLLTTLAGHSIFSDPSILQLPQGSSESRDVLLANILKRLTSSEGKWLIRLVLKDLSPLKLDEAFILRSYHFLLPDLLRFQATFSSAVTLLKGSLKEYPERPDPRSERLLRKQAAPLIKPCVGTKVGRPEFTKARSTDHCLKMLGKQQWVLERKYDGEYCEVHIDLLISTDPAKCIKIFSKSGKDSTLDRKGIHKTLLRCLKLGRPESKIKRRAIILGELFVWSDQEKEPMPFDKIRKFVTRSGVRISADADSQRQPDEHLAIAFFDLLLLDDEIVMAKPIEERRQWLRETYTKIEGRALGAQWKVVDFADEEKSKRVLLQQFAASNAGRCEGLVLKPCGLPYFALHSRDDGYKHNFIKLKADYISEMGDEADFAVVGASYNAQQALKSGLKGLKWTDFHLGTLLNKEDVLRFGTRPRFRVVGTIQQAFCIPKPVLKTANIIGNLSAEAYDPNQQPPAFDLHNPLNIKIDTVFRTPLVFEVLGAGFQKPSNSDFYMLRHARVKKLHQDRSWKDCTSFQELQDQAATARTAPVDSESQETRQWIERLERKCRRKFERERTATPGSTTTSNSPTSSVLPACRLLGTSSPASSLVNITATEERQPLRHVPNNSIRSQSSTGSQPLAGGASNSIDKNLLNSRPTTTTTITKRRLDENDPTPCPAAKRPCVSLLARYAHATTIGQRQETHATSVACDHHDVSAGKGCPTSCQLSNTTIYLASCLRHTPYITQTLLPTHSPLSLVPCLSYWDRASFTHDRLSETVSESQSYPGMRKIVLVESKRDEATQDVIKDVLALNHGRFEERVEVWDWRVLGTLGLAGGHALGKTGRKWFLGATIWDEGKGGSVFVWNGARF
jgi:DNA ligase-4